MPVPPTDTVTVRATAIAVAAVAVTVTDVPDASSPSTFRFSDKVTESLSSSVSVIVAFVIVVFGLLPSTPIVSLYSTRVSWVGVRVKLPVPLVAFAAMVIVKSVTAA